MTRKRLYYISLLALALFEVANVYFIMPMPGSQRMDSLELAYFLYTYRWWFRFFFGLLALVSLPAALTSARKWVPVLALLPVIALVILFNFRMTADHMFLQPAHLVLANRAENTLADSTVVLVLEQDGEAKAYPLRYIIYHHQVRDSVGGKPAMITYCSVCRTGRAYEPVVNGEPETFRLVGMDHFNAMFEDERTRSWWRQATGEAVAGPLTGTVLPELPTHQMTLSKFFLNYPFGEVMQPDEASLAQYDSLGKFEYGRSKSSLTGTDSLSWNDKSWVVGIVIKDKARAYDWNLLKEQRLVHDLLNGVSLVVALSEDQHSFVTFQRSPSEQFSMQGDTLLSQQGTFLFSGKSLTDSIPDLRPIQSSQEFWHSWQTFHPATDRYQP